MNSDFKLKYESRFRTTLWIGIVLLIIILLVFSYLRVNDVMHSLRTETLPPEGDIEYGYARQPLLTFLHILPGIVFIVLGTLQFIKSLRNRFINVHRWIGRIYILIGLIVGITALIMGFVVRFGGFAETSAVVVFGLYFLYALIKAYVHIRRKEFNLHREWMIRAYSIGLAVATMRPVIGLLFAFTDISFSAFFGYTFWFAFIVHFMVAELWIAFTRPGNLNQAVPVQQ